MSFQPSGNVTLLGTYDFATGSGTPTAIARPLAVLNLTESFVTDFLKVFHAVLLPLATAGGSTAIDLSTTLAGIVIDLKAGTKPGEEFVTTLIGFFVGKTIGY